MEMETITQTQLADVDKTTLAHVHLSEIEIGDSNKMFRDETDFQDADFEDLVNSVRHKGVIQPVLLRPGKKKKYELVCGERRYRASMSVMAEFKTRSTIPANIRKLTDDEALECQITENLQRNDVNPMKEALAYSWMAREKKLSAAHIADRIGKSADYVQERLRLNKVIKPVQDLIRSGELPLKAGLKFSRIPEKLQEDALKSVTTNLMLKGDPYNYGDKSAVKKTVFTGMESLKRWMGNHLFIDLDKADFDINDATLSKQNGACSGCKHRSKNTGGLFDDITIEDKCLLAPCFREKQIANYEKISAELSKKFPGKKIAFKTRDGYVEAQEAFIAKLGKIERVNTDHEIPEKKALDNDKAEIAVLVGINPRSYGDHKLDSKKYIWTAPPVIVKQNVAKKKKTNPAPAVKKDPDFEIKDKVTIYLFTLKSVKIANLSTLKYIL